MEKGDLTATKWFTKGFSVARRGASTKCVTLGATYGMSDLGRSVFNKSILGMALCVAVGSACGGEVAAPAAGEPSLKEWVRQLGATDFDERAKAMETLRGLGGQARTQLEAAAQGDDPQVAHAAMTLLRAINRSSLRVEVLDPAGAPMGEKPVTLMLVQQSDSGRAQGQRQNLQAQTDAQGVAKFADLEPGRYHVHARCQAPGFLPIAQSLSMFELKVGESTVKLQARKGSTVKGQILAAGGKPWSGVKVTLGHANYLRFRERGEDQFNKMLEHQPSVQSDAEGRFSFDTVADASYFVAVWSEGKIEHVSAAVSVSEDKLFDLGAIETKLAPPAP
ncbi:MAG: hypothetical protein AMXMBFR7_40890 [Planctomycetota bacterium]